LAARRARLAMGLVVSVILASLASVPVRADTKSELDQARARLGLVQSELDKLARQYSDAETRLAVTGERMADARADVAALRTRMRGLQQGVADRIRAAYVSGPADTVEILLSSGSVEEFADRVQFLGTLARSDSDILAEARVTRERLRRREADLAELRTVQQQTVRALSAQKAAITDRLAEAQALEARLEDRLARERAADQARREAAARLAARQLSAPANSGGALQACPAGNPHSFSDDFGFPRSGGRTHQGIDLLAPLGTPIFAAQSGRYEDNVNGLGGISALVFASNGDYTYYAHMSARAGVPSGASVSAGRLIGYVGNSGDAVGGPYHLHFEYHPGGGSAIDPYRMLVALC
jgi:peptidoglycan LD-endopeptidase LytH